MSRRICTKCTRTMAPAYGLSRLHICPGCGEECLESYDEHRISEMMRENARLRLKVRNQRRNIKQLTAKYIQVLYEKQKKVAVGGLTNS